MSLSLGSMIEEKHRISDLQRLFCTFGGTRNGPEAGF